jgi:hypothetical protein
MFDVSWGKEDTMKTRTRTPLDVTVAYAANLRGEGVAYVRVPDGAPVRVPFRVERFPALLEREVGYAALTAAVGALRAQGKRALRIGIPDERIVDDLAGRRTLPFALALPYVRLRCALNSLRDATVVARPVDEDLVGRARAEVELSVAA